MKMYFIAFSVRGKGKFPLDMLRYDRCCPGKESDTLKIAPTRGGDLGLLSEEIVYREIDLCAIAPREWQPTRDRWSSFGWEVTCVVKARAV